MQWEPLFKQHLDRKGFLISHWHGGSLIWRKHTQLTTRQERLELTTQPWGCNSFAIYCCHKNLARVKHPAVLLSKHLKPESATR